MRTALLAGRAASRWAASTPTTALRPSFIPSTYAANPSRCFSCTRPARQEAEAAAPFDSRMSHYMQNRAQQQEATPVPPAQTPANRADSNDVFAPAPSQRAGGLTQPWTSPSSWAKPKPGVVASSTVDQDMLELRKDRPDHNDVATKRMEQYYEDPNKRKLRLRPVVGRTIDFDTVKDARGTHLGPGLMRLNAMCRNNSVKQESNRQKFHERPGMKRKRQKTERWVKRFRVGFQATCKRVSELAKQGW